MTKSLYELAKEYSRKNNKSIQYSLGRVYHYNRVLKKKRRRK